MQITWNTYMSTHACEVHVRCMWEACEKHVRCMWGTRPYTTVTKFIHAPVMETNIFILCTCTVKPSLVDSPTKGHLWLSGQHDICIELFNTNTRRNIGHLYLRGQKSAPMCPLLIGFTVLQQRDFWLKFAQDKATPTVFMKDMVHIYTTHNRQLLEPEVH